MSEPTEKEKAWIQDLWIVNTVSGWAKAQLKILSEMAADHKIEPWCVREIIRIHDEIITVSGLEHSRNNLSPTVPPTAIEETQEKKNSGIPDAPSDRVEHVRQKEAEGFGARCGAVLRATCGHGWIGHKDVAAIIDGQLSELLSKHSNASGEPPVSEEVAAPPSSKSEEWTEKTL